MLFLLIYLLLGLLTAMYSSFEIGKEQRRIKTISPASFAQVNWVNQLCSTLLWPAFWASKWGAYQVGLETKMEAADALEIPRDQVIR